jgi:glycosyltransferase involved in cell wall biosynthesis
MRVAILWTGMSGYMDASLRALASRGVEIFISHSVAHSDAPFGDRQFSWIEHRYLFKGRPQLAELGPLVEAFHPDLLVIDSWHIPTYRRLARLHRGRVPRVLCMDNQWKGNWRNWLGVSVRDWYIRPLYDFAWVSGSSSGYFARKLGFSGRQVFYGLNTCDHAAFARARRARVNPDPAESFLFVGRLGPEKRIDVLAEGYRRYRRRARMPWPLLVCGIGPEARWLQGVDGVELRGFVQPSDLPDHVAGVGCFVIVSSSETWSIAIHEATAAGLPIISTTSCGASVHLVQDGHNGFLIEPGDAEQLADAMLDLTCIRPAERIKMGEASANLSLQYTPERWVDTLFAIKNTVARKEMEAQRANPNPEVTKTEAGSTI